MIGSIGLLTLVLGSSLFAIATWRSRSLSRGASVLLAAGAVLVVPALFVGGAGGGGFQWSVAIIPVIGAIVAFPAGWIALGVSALRITGPAAIRFEAASVCSVSSMRPSR